LRVAPTTTATLARGRLTAFGAIGITELMDLVKRNAEIVALVKARKIPRRKIAVRYRLSVSTISSIAIKHGVRAYVKIPDPEKLRAAKQLINRGMPLTHVARTVGFNIQTLRRILEDEGLYVRSRDRRRLTWFEAQLADLKK
jgi:hypothetical protein